MKHTHSETKNTVVLQTTPTDISFGDGLFDGFVSMIGLALALESDRVRPMHEDEVGHAARQD